MITATIAAGITIIQVVRLREPGINDSQSTALSSDIHESGADVVAPFDRHDVNESVSGFAGSGGFGDDADDIIYPGIVDHDIDENSRNQCFIFDTAIHGKPRTFRPRSAD